MMQSTKPVKESETANPSVVFIVELTIAVLLVAVESTIRCCFATLRLVLSLRTQKPVWQFLRKRWKLVVVLALLANSPRPRERTEILWRGKGKEKGKKWKQKTLYAPDMTDTALGEFVVRYPHEDVEVTYSDWETQYPCTTNAMHAIIGDWPKLLSIAHALRIDLSDDKGHNVKQVSDVLKAAGVGCDVLFFDADTLTRAPIGEGRQWQFSLGVIHAPGSQPHIVRHKRSHVAFDDDHMFIVTRMRHHKRLVKEEKVAPALRSEEAERDLLKTFRSDNHNQDPAELCSPPMMFQILGKSEWWMKCRRLWVGSLNQKVDCMWVVVMEFLRASMEMVLVIVELQMIWSWNSNQQPPWPRRRQIQVWTNNQQYP
jgi:hypothetical protein